MPPADRPQTKRPQGDPGPQTPANNYGCESVVSGVVLAGVSVTSPHKLLIFRSKPVHVYDRSILNNSWSNFEIRITGLDEQHIQASVLTECVRLITHLTLFINDYEQIQIVKKNCFLGLTWGWAYPNCLRISQFSSSDVWSVILFSNYTVISFLDTLIFYIYVRCVMNINIILVELPDVSVSKSGHMMFSIQVVSLNVVETQCHAINASHRRAMPCNAVQCHAMQCNASTLHHWNAGSCDTRVVNVVNDEAKLRWVTFLLLRKILGDRRSRHQVPQRHRVPLQQCGTQLPFVASLPSTVSNHRILSW